MFEKRNGPATTPTQCSALGLCKYILVLINWTTPMAQSNIYWRFPFDIFGQGNPVMSHHKNKQIQLVFYIWHEKALFVV